MLVLKLELWPHGDEARAREIGRTYIANTGEGTLERGNYVVGVCRKGSKGVPKEIYQGHPFGVGLPKAARTGEVRDYPRISYNVWRLIVRALRSAFPEEK